MRGRGKTIMAALLCALVAGLIAQPASAGDKTYARFALKKQYKPSSLFIGAHTIVDQITWTDWARTRADGTGTFQYQDCIPDCASGKTIPIPATLVLKGRRECGNYHIFKKLTIAYTLNGAPKELKSPGVCSAKKK